MFSQYKCVGMNWAKYEIKGLKIKNKRKYHQPVKKREWLLLNIMKRDNKKTIKKGKNCQPN